MKIEIDGEQHVFPIRMGVWSAMVWPRLGTILFTLWTDHRSSVVCRVWNPADDTG